MDELMGKADRLMGPANLSSRFIELHARTDRKMRGSTGHG